MADTSHAKLSGRIIKLLRSDACKRINFSARNIRINGLNFNKVVELINAPTSNGIHIEINKKFLDGRGYEALYNDASKLFVFKSEDIGIGSAFQRQAIVHEATHALVDNTLQTSTSHETGEILAYISGAVYIHLSGSKLKPDSAIRRAADVLALKVVGAGPGGYIFAASELTALTAAIRARYSEADEELEVEKTRTMEIVEPIGIWEVKSGPRDGPLKWTWLYDFKENGTVSWRDPYNGKHGNGHWTLSRAELRLKTRWTGSITTEEWTPPMNAAEGLNATNMNGTATMQGSKEYWLHAEKI